MKKFIIALFALAFFAASCTKEECPSVGTATLQITDFSRVKIAADEKKAVVLFNFKEYKTESTQVVEKLKSRIAEGQPFALDVFLLTIQDARKY
jgi:hypothetical protein